MNSQSPLLNPYLNTIFAASYPGKPQQSLTRTQALKAFTETAAYAEFAENSKGTLEAGKLADLAVLSQDIPTVPSADLPKTESVLTYGGRKDSLCKRGIRPTLGFQLQRPTDAPNISVLSSRQSER